MTINSQNEKSYSVVGPFTADLQLIIENVKENTDIDNLSELEKKNLLKELATNNPALEIFSSFENYGDNFTQILFNGIKSLNDNHSQEFSDLLLIKIKNYIQQFISNKEKNYNIVWNDYKNFVIKLGDKNNYITEFSKYNKNYIYDKYIKLCKEQNIEAKFIKDNFPLTIKYNEGTIEENKGYLFKENIVLSLSKSTNKLEAESIGYKYGGYREYLKKGYIDEFNNNLEDEEYSENNTIYIVNKKNNIFSIKKNGEYKEFDIFLDEEINSKLYELFINGKIPKKTKLFQNLSNTYYITEQKDIIEEELIEKNIKYTVKDNYLIIKNKKNKTEEKIEICTQYPFLGEEMNFYNILLIEKYKNNELPEELSLTKKIKKILNLLKIEGGFILPEWNDYSTKEYNEKLKEYKKIKKSIDKGESLKNIKEYLESSPYKGGITKKEFEKEISDKKNSGTLVYYDIKNLGIYNILSNKKEIDEGKDINKSRLESCQTITYIIKSLINLEDIPKDSICIGGDEGKIFFKSKNINEIKKFVKRIQEKAKELGIHLRIIVGEKEKENDGINLIDSMDAKTKLSKEIEKVFSLIEQRRVNYSRKIKKDENEIKKILINNNFNDIQKILENFTDEKNKIESEKETLDNLKKFYISFEKGEWKINILEEIFLLSKIFDDKGFLKKDSDFIKFLDQKGLGRNKSR